MRRIAAITAFVLLVSGLAVLVPGQSAQAAPSTWTSSKLARAVSPGPVSVDETGRLYVVDYIEVQQQIRRLDRVTGAVVKSWTAYSLGLDEVQGMTVRNNRMYLTDGSTIKVFDATTGAPIAGFTPPKGVEPFEMAVYGPRLYVADFSSEGVIALNATTGARIWSFDPAPAYAQAEVITADSHGVWAAGYDGVHLLDAASGVRRGTVKVKHANALAADGTSLFVGSDDAGLSPVAKFSASTGARIPAFDPPNGPGLVGSPFDLAADGAGHVYAADEERVRAYDSTTGAPVAGFDTSAGGVPVPIWMTSDRAGHAFTAASGSVARLSTASGAVESFLDTTAVGILQPYGLAADADALYVSGNGAGGTTRLRKLDPVTGALDHGFSAPISAVRTPSRLALDGAGHLFVIDGTAGKPRIVRLDAETGAVVPGFNPKVTLRDPGSLAADSAGHLYVSDLGDDRTGAGQGVHKLSTATGAWYSAFNVSTKAIPAYGLAADDAGRVYLSSNGDVEARNAVTGAVIPSFRSALVKAGVVNPNRDDGEFGDFAMDSAGRVLLSDYSRGIYRFTPGAPTSPNAPDRVAGTSALGAVTVRITTPADNGGSPVTGFDVVASPGGATCHATAAQAACTISGLTNGTFYRFRATATNAVGTSGWSSQSTPVAAGQVNNVSGPRITGTARVAKTLTCAVTYPGADKISYRWTRDGKTIKGTARQHKVLTADHKRRLACTTTAHNKYGWTYPVTSASVLIAAGDPLKAKVKPKVTASKKTAKGKIPVGAVLRVTKGRWTPGATSVTYRWMRDGNPIDGATKRSYTIKKADRGSKVTVVVTAHRKHFKAGVHKSKARTVAGKRPPYTGPIWVAL